MDMKHLPDNPYLLLTPGPLSTTKTVKSAMLRDWCTWDDDYNHIVEQIRSALTKLAAKAGGYTAVLMQGSGTFAVEAAVTTVVPTDGKLLVVANGAYGLRIAEIARRAGIDFLVHDSGETQPPDLKKLSGELQRDAAITHVAAVHCETTTGMLNPAEEIGLAVQSAGRTFILDAMSSFGGVPMDMAQIAAGYLVSSANKCIQGVPGFGFVIAEKTHLQNSRGQARSLSLDLYDQWRVMEDGRGKWRFTSPTHTVRAFFQALKELEQEGGVSARHARYRRNQRLLVEGMTDLGFQPLLPASLQSPIITAFISPNAKAYDFRRFYDRLKENGFVIYPGKVTSLDTFRIGNIGDVHETDIRRLLSVVKKAIFWKSS